MQLIVMGMHRAGTSVLARLLNMMGAYYGPEGIHFGASSENAKGFWERKDVLELHQTIFSSQHIDWDKPSAFDLKALLKDQTHSLAIKNLLLELEAHRPWMLKDPRMCLLLPLWKPHLEMPVCIHINRPAIQVAQSLHQRSGMSLHTGVALWEFYNVQAFNASADMPRVLIQHQDLMTRPVKVINTLYQQLCNFNVQGLRLPSQQEIKAFVDPNLFRQKGSDELQQAFCNAPQLQLQGMIDSGSILKTNVDKPIKVSIGAMAILEQYEQKQKDILEHQRLEQEMQTLRDTAKSHYQSYLKEHDTLEQQADYFQANIGVLTQKKQLQQQHIKNLQQENGQLSQTLIKKKEQYQQQQQQQKEQYQQQQQQQKEQYQQQQQQQKEQYQQQQQQFKAWFSSLDHDIQATFQSLTWKLGHGLVTIIRKILFIKGETATDHIYKTLAEIQQQQGLNASEKKKPTNINNNEANKHHLLPLYRRLWRLLNWNNAKLFWLALKNIRQMGIQAFVQRSAAYVQGTENPVVTRLDLTMVLSQHNNSVIPAHQTEIIDIIIPIYNGLKHLQRLIPSILNNTEKDSYRLILFDDASPDKTVKQYLEQIEAQYKTIILIRGTSNQGFIGAVNGAFKQAVQHHFVILNQDTEVPPHWLPRLMQPILTQVDKIACTTPFTNAGTICSFPQFLADNLVYRDLEVAEIDQAFQTIAYPNPVIAMPTGVGFCMGMNKHLVDKIGLFNQDLFGRGYAEENDWCQRAILAGYQNIAVPNLFVFHEHGSIFSSEEKAYLIKTNLVTLNQQHPTYSQQVQAFIASDPLKAQRYYALMQIGCTHAKKVHLFFDHGLGGGANMYTQQKIDDWIQIGDAVFLINYDFKQAFYCCQYFDKDQKISLETLTLASIEDLCQIFPISHLHISNLVSFPQIKNICQVLGQWQSRYKLSLYLYIHDYYAVCPSYTLLNQHGNDCQVPEDLKVCQQCLKQHEGEFNLFISAEDKNISTWRQAWGQLLIQAQAVYCFSNASADIMTKAYPALVKPQIQVIPHQVNDIQPLAPATAHTSLNIGILGAINHQKGLDIIKTMLLEIAQQGLDIRIIVIGHLAENIEHPQLLVTGRYQREDLSKLISQHQIDLFFMPSIWAETFSYTSEEVMKMNYPLAVFALGAPAERVKEYQKGLVIEPINATEALQEIQAWVAKNDKFRNKSVKKGDIE